MECPQWNVPMVYIFTSTALQVTIMDENAGFVSGGRRKLEVSSRTWARTRNYANSKTLREINQAALHGQLHFLHNPVFKA
jgi:hypothetical protein